MPFDGILDHHQFAGVRVALKSGYFPYFIAVYQRRLELEHPVGGHA